MMPQQAIYNRKVYVLHLLFAARLVSRLVFSRVSHRIDANAYTVHRPHTGCFIGRRCGGPIRVCLIRKLTAEVRVAHSRPQESANIELFQITSWFRIAYWVISALFLTPSFFRIRARWLLIVFTLRDSSLAISVTVFPEAMRHMTSYSRSESVSCGVRVKSFPTLKASFSASVWLTYRPPSRILWMAFTNSSGALSFVM